MDIRAQLQERLTEYVEDTLSDIETVKDFCDQEQKWSSERKAEIKKMRHVCGNQEKLDAVLKDTLEGLKKLEPFLEALEKLAVTSSHVFSEQIFLLRGESPETVQSVIEDARTDAPVLIHFKRDAEAFFQPLLDNVDVLVDQLDNYIDNTRQLCERVRGNSVLAADIYNRNRDEPSVQLIVNVNENAMKQMLDHLQQLCEIRMNQDTRLVFLFQEKAQTFIDVFSERRSRMWQFQSDLKCTADKLASMKYGASISNVVGSSVGIVGGVLSVLGIIFAPFTAGASLAFTATGLGLGITSGANALVTGVTEMAVNSQQEHNAQSYLESYKEDMIKIEECLNEVANSKTPLVQPSTVDAEIVYQGVANVAKECVDALAAYASRKTEKATAAVTRFAMHDLEMANAKTMSIVKCSRVASGLTNFLFIGLDIYSIVNESISLHHGSKSEVSNRIRSRAALFKSEMEAWEKMYDSLCIGIETISKSRDTLEKEFLP